MGGARAKTPSSRSVETQRAVSYFETPSRHADPQYLDNMGNVIPPGKLPGYAIPEAIIPLEKFSLNPNGKNNKPALPLQEAAELGAALSEAHAGYAAPSCGRVMSSATPAPASLTRTTSSCA